MSPVVLNTEKWKQYIPALQKEFKEASPFPYLILDDFLEDHTARMLLAVFPQTFFEKGWIHWRHYNEDKHGLNDPKLLPVEIASFIAYMNSADFVRFLSDVTGINDLLPDPELEGGGIHLSERGGHLNIHADFSTHPRHGDMHRMLNVLLYLNPDWRQEYRGDLEFWSADMKHCEKKISPIFNRLVIFRTTDTSYHGFPDPILCPSGESRKSIALYYYNKSTTDQRVISTSYQTRPGEGLKVVPNWIDNKLLFAYTLAKRKLGIKDNLASSLLGFKEWFRKPGK